MRHLTYIYICTRILFGLARYIAPLGGLHRQTYVYTVLHIQIRFLYKLKRSRGELRITAPITIKTSSQDMYLLDLLMRTLTLEHRSVYLL